MTIHNKYVVYNDNKLLTQVYFDNTENLFDSEQDAIDALIEAKMFSEEYLILKIIYITK